MSKPLYVCFEGLDGSGKSTLYEAVYKTLQQEGYNVYGLCPTKKVEAKDSENEGVEWLYDKCPKLKNSRYYRQFLYAYRSNYAARHIDWKADIILGDRSLITSYVCRWGTSEKSNKELVEVVNDLESLIPAPDYVIYLEVAHEEIQRRLDMREKRDIDESAERSLAMRQAYDYLRENPSVVRRLENTQWYVINGNQSQEEVRLEALKFIHKLITLQKKG